MSKSLTIAYCTSREKPCVEWLFGSLLRQVCPSDRIEIIIVDLLKNTRPLDIPNRGVIHVDPKPSIWQGKHRITKDQWWDKSNSLNTSLALAHCDYFATVDDRSILCPGWLQAVRDAMEYTYAVVGPYEKVHNLVVEDGQAKSYTETDGKDNRVQYIEQYWKPSGLRNPFKTNGGWWYGCSTALPLEWALECNGYSEDVCGSLGAEDSAFGMVLHNNGRPIFLDERMKLLEDRTPSELGTPMKRSDFGVSPNDKSHAAVERLRHSLSSLNSYDLRKLRADIQAGKPWPMPTAPHKDWYDGEDIPTKFNKL